ncbi:YggT family protein [Temperatibacter marinus]|uniref:YggT family protein n=1 Tax=Temperatibacter marinus TaxID=1456591 RepID=A0AA52EEI2_9PROT|nr:YggT family protein [Temperatibacter marinus]WND03240.1 YggT family protein [Temperatibacter marinus]
MGALFWLVDTVIGIMVFCLIANVIASWLVAFGVINIYQPVVRTLLDALSRITNPIVQPIRRYLPAMGGLDLSPLIALILLQFVRILIVGDLQRALM